MEKVNFKAAVKEIKRFLDATGIDFDFEIEDIKSIKIEKEDKDVDNLIVVKRLIRLVTKGHIVIDEKGNLTYILKFPKSNDEKLQRLTYINRINVQNQYDKLTQFKVDDADGRIIAATAARTGQNTVFIKSMDQIDYDNAALITNLFL